MITEQRRIELKEHIGSSDIAALAADPVSGFGCDMNPFIWVMKFKRLEE